MKSSGKRRNPERRRRTRGARVAWSREVVHSGPDAYRGRAVATPECSEGWGWINWNVELVCMW